MTKNPIERIIAGRKAINNALTTPEIMEILSNYNVTTRVLDAGLNLCRQAEDLISIQKKEYGESYDATEVFNKLFSNAIDEHYKAYIVAKIVLRGNVEAAKALVLNGKRKQSFSGWFGQAKPFYTNLLNNESYLSAMTAYAFTPERLQIGFDLLKQCEQSAQHQQKELSQAMAATKDRDDKLDSMDDWLFDFKSICKLALGKNSEYYQTLGF